jgi:ABC-2 type transport system permease protein
MSAAGVPGPTAPAGAWRSVGPPSSADRARAGFTDVVRSEWRKLRTVRSTYWSLLAAALLVVGLGAVFSLAYASNYHSLSASAKATFDPTVTSLSGVWFGQLAIGVLAILSITAEYSTGTIRPSLAAVPHRGRMLAAKVTVFTGVTVAVGEAASFAAFFAGQPLLAGRAPHAALGDPGVLRAIAGGGLYLGAVGLFSVAIGVLIRHTAGAITIMAAVAFVVPTVLVALPASWQGPIGRWLPTNAGSTLWSVRHVAHMFTAWTGFGVFLGYTAVLLAWAFVVFARRDN